MPATPAAEWAICLANSIVESASDINYTSYGAARSLSGRERLNGERDTLGLYLTGHPIDEYEEELRMMHPNRISKLRPAKVLATVSRDDYRDASDEEQAR